MSFPRYTKYKNSRVEWLGEVPAHWEVKRLGALFKEVSEEGDSTLPILSVSIHDGVSDSELNESELDRKVSRSEDPSKYKRIEPGDLVYNMMRAWQGAFGTATVKGMVSPAYVVARPTTRVSTTLLEFALRTPQAIEEMRRHSRGVTDFRLRLYWDEFKTISVPVPPDEEQLLLEKFVGREAQAIDALVGEQQRLIELLNEKRQAVISQSVTKGLNPDAPIKASGIDSLGDVPAHWLVVPLGSLCTKIGSGKTPLGGAEAYVDEGVLFVRSQNVYDEGLRLDDVVFITESVDDDMRQSRVQPGDVLLNITGASLGRTCIVPSNMPRANVNQHVCILRLRDPALRGYVAMVLKSRALKGQFDAAQNGAAREGLNYQQIARLRLPIPPAAERVAILEKLSGETATLDALSAEAQRAIALLQERRTALISAAVTGVIDVRALARAGGAVA